MKLGRIGLVGVTATTGLLVGTTSAWAYFATTGQGTGTADVSRLSVQVLAAGPGSASSGLLPGHSGDAVLRLHNPQAVPITLVSVEAAGVPTADNGCNPTGVGFLNQDQLNVLLPAGSTKLVPLPDSVTMDLGAAAACQGAQFDIPVTVTVRS